MIEITVKSKKYAGQYKVYTLGEEGCPEVNYQRETVKVGDWIVDCNNLVSQIIHLVKPMIAGITTVMSIYTCYGIDGFLVSKREEHYYTKLDFNRPRISFHSLSRGADRVRGISYQDKVFLYNTLINGDMYKAHEIAYKNKRNDGTISNKFNQLLSTKQGQEFIRNMIGEKLKEFGVEADFFIKKLIESVDGKIDSELKLALLRMLAAGAGDKEIIRMLSDQSNENPNQPLLPTSSVEPPKQIEEAKFTETNTEGLKV